MCGISGFSGPTNSHLLHQMSDSLIHRGPDEVGFYEEEEAISLGHRRLSIIDLATGHQPIFGRNNRYVVIYNGEIYNFLELKCDLENRGYSFHTKTDTEVIVHAFEEYGAAAFQKFNGMFAFALWDRKTQSLYLVRDRFGIKPIYYSLLKGHIFFSSEIKALLKNKNISQEINPASLHRYFTFRYVPGAETIFKSVQKLLPGQFLKYRSGKIEIKNYWNLLESASCISEQNTIQDVQERFEHTFCDAVKKCLTSDVPVGLFLSGGVDSTSLAGAMKHLGHSPIQTFSIGFDLPLDELSEARRVAQYFGTEHHEFKLETSDLDILPKALYHLDEPNADSIIIPLYLLSQKAGQHVKVVLSGEGADEIFGGYFFQKQLFKLNKWASFLPALSLSLLSKTLGVVPIAMLDHFFEYSGSLGMAGRQRLQTLIEASKNPFLSYMTVAQLFTEEEKKSLLLNDDSFKYKQDSIVQDLEALTLGATRTYLDTLILREMRYWLPDYILTRQDKLSMAHSLEMRVPYLDHRLFELLLAMPLAVKRANMREKAMLRQTVNHLFPKHPLLKSKKKKAFYLPFEGKFQKPFQEWLNTYLHPNRIRQEGLLNVQFVEDLKKKASKSPLLYHKQLMSLIIWEIWREIRY